MWKEFKEFAVKGNVMDLAIGVIIGAAFGKIVDSFVNDLIMPVIGVLTGGIDFTNKFAVLRGEVAPGATLEAAGPPERSRSTTGSSSPSCSTS